MDDQTDYRSVRSKHSITLCSSLSPSHCILIDCVAWEVGMVPASILVLALATFALTQQETMLSENRRDNADDG